MSIDTSLLNEIADHALLTFEGVGEDDYIGSGEQRHCITTVLEQHGIDASDLSEDEYDACLYAVSVGIHDACLNSPDDD